MQFYMSSVKTFHFQQTEDFFYFIHLFCFFRGTCRSKASPGLCPHLHFLVRKDGGSFNIKKKKRLRRLMRSKSDSSTDMKHFPVPQHTHVDLLKWALLSWFHVFSCLLCKTSWKLQHNFNVIITWLVCQFLDAFYDEGSTRQRFLYMYS